ncbi:hypothetical protein [Chenggangzhangella methanolivorans]|uniref:Uncharacterized protein n=1 Tax=Chenggangzhangella methanolivorans TaxID=1437009 RepID=A0A9E6REM6_9HYPH|nr:hypothetical protein [Chenggangzhangella methanolivorans]QZO02094.1 hypothetical protein K6K41_12960 [Chenggangzhangella methanolivorans]
MMEVKFSYWVYAAIQSLLFMICATGAVFCAFWAWESRTPPRPTLWWLLPFIAAMDVGLMVDATKWILVRASNTEHSVEMIQAVKTAQNYTEYALTRGFVLTIAAQQVWSMWSAQASRLTADGAVSRAYRAVDRGGVPPSTDRDLLRRAADLRGALNPVRALNR